MDLALVLGAAALVLSLQVVLIVQIFKIGDKVSKVMGQYGTHLKGCDDRFKRIEQRLNIADI